MSVRWASQSATGWVDDHSSKNERHSESIAGGSPINHQRHVTTSTNGFEIAASDQSKMILPIAGGCHVAWVEVAVHEHIGRVDRLDACDRLFEPTHELPGTLRRHIEPRSQPGIGDRSREVDRKHLERPRLASGGEQVRLATGERALGAGEVSERSTMVGGVGHHRPRAEIVEQQPTAIGVDRDNAGDEPGQLAVEELRDRSLPAERLEHRFEPVAPSRGVDPHHRRYAPLTELDDGGRLRQPALRQRLLDPFPGRGVPTGSRPVGAKRVGPGATAAFVQPAAQAFGQSRFDRHRAPVGRDRRPPVR